MSTTCRTSRPTAPDLLNRAPVLAFAHATKPKQGKQHCVGATDILTVP
jgi:hypothetical protein